MTAGYSSEHPDAKDMHDEQDDSAMPCMSDQYWLSCKKEMTGTLVYKTVVCKGNDKQ